MIRKPATLCLLLALAATPALPFWGALFGGLGKLVGKAFGIESVSGLMPVTIKSAKPVVDAARQRLSELQDIRGVAGGTLDHFSGVLGTLRELQDLDSFKAPATHWLRSVAADRFGTSAAWTSALNGDLPSARVVDAYSQATVPVPDWDRALPALDPLLLARVQREHASLEIADAASVRSLAVLGEARALAAQRASAHDNLERAALDPSNASQSMPALMGKLTLGQVRQLRSAEQTNQLLDALLESQLAASKRERDQLARSMSAAAAYSELAGSQLPPAWRMP